MPTWLLAPMIKHGVAKGQCSEDKEEIEEFLRVDSMPACKEKYEKLVLASPDDYRSWNKLKRIFLENPRKYLEEQLLLTQKAIMVNPKSYFVWHHRYYLSVEGYGRRDAGCADTAGAVRSYDEFIDHEQKLCSLLLSVDPRNFHCWNYCLKNKICIAPDYANYSSLREHNNKAVELLYSDPNDEGSWRFYMRVEKGKRLGCFYARLFRNCMELVFKEPFCGELRINKDRVRIGDYVRYYKHNRNDNGAALDGGGIVIGVLQAPNTVFTTCKLRPLKNGEEIIDNILELQPNCIFAMKEKLKHTKDLEGRGILINRLCELDKLRQKYYRSLLDRHYEVYVIEGQ